jgi:8-oxo-dGTP pyrophosphatase MutT (NUDIX family)
MENKEYKKSVGALVIDRNRPNMCLMVSRKNDHTDFGTIGGKLDAGETDADALPRELLEETGYCYKGSVLVPMFFC